MALSQKSGASFGTADKYENNQDIEMQWAMKTLHHAETYFSLITAIDPVNLKLTQCDDEVYSKFREKFKDMNVEVVDEDQMKSPEGKVQWREYCNQFEHKVEDFNFASLLRLDAREEVSEKNSTVVPRIQWLAIEIARNREGYNSHLRHKFKEAQQKKKEDLPKESEEKGLSDIEKQITNALGGH